MAARFAGKSVNLGGKDYIVPAIAIGKLKELSPRIAKLDFSGRFPSPEDLDTVLDMTLAALNRNYPEMTKEEIGELVDLGNLKEVVDVVAGQSGLVASGKPALEGTLAP